MGMKHWLTEQQAHGVGEVGASHVMANGTGKSSHTPGSGKSHSSLAWSMTPLPADTRDERRGRRGRRRRWRVETQWSPARRASPATTATQSSLEQEAPKRYVGECLAGEAASRSRG